MNYQAFTNASLTMMYDGSRDLFERPTPGGFLGEP
jgi:hypothetical protein